MFQHNLASSTLFFFYIITYHWRAYQCYINRVLPSSYNKLHKTILITKCDLGLLSERSSAAFLLNDDGFLLILYTLRKLAPNFVLVCGTNCRPRITYLSVFVGKFKYWLRLDKGLWWIRMFLNLLLRKTPSWLK